MKKKVVFLFLLIACHGWLVEGQTVKTVILSSPSKNLTASVYVDSGRGLCWSLQLNGKVLVAPSELGISVDHRDLGDDVEIGRPVISMVNERYPWKGVHSLAMNYYRQVEMAVMNKKTGSGYRLQCRIFNDGFAFRYIVPAGGASLVAGGSSLVTGESSSWAIPSGSTVWYQDNIYYYEGLYYASPVGGLGVKQLGPPVTYRTPDGAFASITEAALYNYSGMSLRSDSGGVLHAAFVNDPGGWTISGEVVSPWRVVVAGKDLDALVNSDIIQDLNPAPDSLARHADWIKPGRAVWSYFVHDNVTTLQLEKNYVDKAAELGFEYSVVDAGWDTSWPNSLDSLQMLVNYAQKKGRIGILVWKSYASLSNDSVRRAFFRTMNRIGVVGVKIDYIDKEGVDQVRFYENALRDAMSLRLMIDFHGANKPTGYNRRFPNEITREGIYGQEWRTYTPEGAVNNAILPFTRFLAGPGDYTPGVFNSSLAYGTSRAQQLALPIIYNSPLMCWPDDPDVYLASPALSVIRSIPPVWDATKVLAPSDIGRVAAFARRKGKDWFIGVINAGEQQRFQLPLAFLGSDRYRVEILADDLRNSDGLLHSITACTARDTLAVVMKAKGGYVAMLSRVDDPPPAIVILPGGGYLTGPVEVRIMVKDVAKLGLDAAKTGLGAAKLGRDVAAAKGAKSASAARLIRYTTDGSEPDGRSAIYRGGLTVTQPQLIRARVFDGGKPQASSVIAQFLNAPAPVVSPAGGIFTGSLAVRMAPGIGGDMPGSGIGGGGVSGSAVERAGVSGGTVSVTDKPGSTIAQADIRYTLDGSDPTRSSPVFEGPLVLDSSVTLKSRLFFRSGGQSEMSELRFRRVDPDAALTTVDSAQGLHYSYYEGKWDSMPDFKGLVPVKQGRAATPDLSGIPTRQDYYSVQFRGYVNISETGVYTFYTVSDDGSQLYIGDEKVVDNDGCHGDLERSGDRALAVGRHAFTLNYFQNSSGKTLQVYIKGPHVEKQLVTAGLFR
jgi:hypothetical protein